MTDIAIHTQHPAAATGPATAAATDTASDFGAFLDTVLDIVNPLQHLPVVSTIYRAVTGDTIGAPARLVGGALYGGPLGAASAAVNLIVEGETGHDIGEHALALLTGEDSEPGEQLASLDGMPLPVDRGELVYVAYGDANAMTPDAVSWRGDYRRPGAAAVAQAAARPTVEAPPDAVPDAAPVTAAVASRPTATTEPPQTNLPNTADTTAAVQAAPSPLASVATPPVPDAATANLPQMPAWFAAALTQAEQGPATKADAAPETPAEWMPAAMSLALDKYKAMAIARSTGDSPINGPADGKADGED